MSMKGAYMSLNFTPLKLLLQLSGANELKSFEYI